MERLGKGAFGAVFRVRNQVDGNEYAIKKVRIREAKMYHVLEEVGIISKLDHPNVIRYYTSWFEEDGGGGEDEKDETEDETETATDRTRDTLTLNDSSRFLPRRGGTPAYLAEPSLSEASPRLGAKPERRRLGPRQWRPPPPILTLALALTLTLVQRQWSLTGEEIPAAAQPKDSSNLIHAAAVKDWVFNGDSSSESGMDALGEPASPTESATAGGEDAPDKLMVLYIQMQLCDPQNLFDWLQTHDRCVVPRAASHLECLDKFRQVVEGLEYVHARRLIHRDLKPANILMLRSETGRDTMKLADFGLSRSLPHSHLMEEIHHGRGEYLTVVAPEARS